MNDYKAKIEAILNIRWDLQKVYLDGAEQPAENWWEIPRDVKEKLKPAIEQLLTEARIEELNGLIGEVGPAIKGETWKDWSWRVKNYLEKRKAELKKGIGQNE